MNKYYYYIPFSDYENILETLKKDFANVRHIMMRHGEILTIRVNRIGDVKIYGYIKARNVREYLKKLKNESN